MCKRYILCSLFLIHSFYAAENPSQRGSSCSFQGVWSIVVQAAKKQYQQAPFASDEKKNKNTVSPSKKNN